MLRDRIAKYGIELEGAWDHVPSGSVHDGSVTLYDYHFVGEIPSPPITLLASLENWIKKNFPIAINESCGMHVHMSFKNTADYALLMDTSAFQDYVLRGLELCGHRSGYDSSHVLFDRLEGYNEYCELSFCPDDQVILTQKEHCRYNVLNYCWSLHRTLEVRVLPMFDTSKESYAAVCEVSRLVNEWLKRKRKRKLKKVTEKLVMPSKYREKKQINARLYKPPLTITEVTESQPIRRDQ